MVSVNIVVHGICISCEDEGVRWEVVDLFQFAQNVGGVTRVSGNEKFDSLKLEIQPSTPMIHKGATAADDRARFPRVLVSFQGHSKACKLGGKGRSRSAKVFLFVVEDGTSMA